ncbi:hypothetical protein ACFOQM_22050 [Paenibacillus sp. GCM10012307]|uniref:SLH domain-containing protein n=1 Tax=Paenibacillus roseus TaxID=2798579 RepID=A0A934J603_9BACL|nr:hypothetical protein [Paenibacillus roseus]MBJ6363914.1 hypothetical protein [Paenibacillus roseus]
MKIHLPANKLLLSAALAATLLLNPLAASVHAAPTAAAATSYETEYGVFLKDKYNIAIKENSTLTRGDLIDYVAALLPKATAESTAKFSDLNQGDPLFAKAALLYDNGILNGPAVAAKQPLTNLAAILIALRASDLKELAYSYPEAKANAALTKAGIPLSVLDLKTKQELAAAIDTGLLPKSYQEKLVLSKPASSQLVQVLLGKIATFQGNYKHYLGLVSDADIYTKIQDAYHTSNIIQIPNLQNIVDTALKQNVVTGYNLKDSRYDSNFVEALSITYGHSDLKHIIQLIGLLRSEYLDAKVQLEPKTSAFIHLKEWGEPYESETAKVVQIENGNYITYAKEFDLKFEFHTVADKEKFQGIILKYAKKNEKDQKGLIAGSWWQPLYYSLTKLDDYKLIANNKIVDGHYYAQSFSLPEKAAEVKEGFAKVDPSIKVESYTFWVDVPFFNYLNGESL